MLLREHCQFYKTQSITGIGRIVLPTSAGIASTPSLGNKVLYKIIINKYKKCKKQYEKHQQSIKSFDKLHRISLQDNVIDKIEYESLSNNFTEYLEGTKN